jgi:hypothetical protein
MLKKKHYTFDRLDTSFKIHCGEKRNESTSFQEHNNTVETDGMQMPTDSLDLKRAFTNAFRNSNAITGTYFLKRFRLFVYVYNGELIDNGPTVCTGLAKLLPSFPCSINTGITNSLTCWPGSIRPRNVLLDLSTTVQNRSQRTHSWSPPALTNTGMIHANTTIIKHR